MLHGRFGDKFMGGSHLNIDALFADGERSASERAALITMHFDRSGKAQNVSQMQQFKMPWTTEKFAFFACVLSSTDHYRVVIAIRKNICPTVKGRFRLKAGLYLIDSLKSPKVTRIADIGNAGLASDLMPLHKNGAKFMPVQYLYLSKTAVGGDKDEETVSESCSEDSGESTGEGSDESSNSSGSSESGKVPCGECFIDVDNGNPTITCAFSGERIHVHCADYFYVFQDDSIVGVRGGRRGQAG
jgi:hypothetical protein